MKFDKDNYNFCYYENQNLKAIISFGAGPDEIEKMNYYLSLIDNKGHDIHQIEFKTLDSVIDFANKKYFKIWDFKDPRQPEKSGGCSSCVAH